jgi:hypothetical protein
VGLREQINQKPVVTSAVIGGLILLVIVWTIWQFIPHRPSDPTGIKLYYTTDGGKTWFADAAEKVPPFDHDGSPAVRCQVFKTATSAPFAGYLETYSKQMHDQLTGGAPVQGPPGPASTGLLIKRPGDKTWVPELSPQGQRITSDIKIPDGFPGSAEEVSP